MGINRNAIWLFRFRKKNYNTWQSQLSAASFPTWHISLGTIVVALLCYQRHPALSIQFNEIADGLIISYWMEWVLFSRPYMAAVLQESEHWHLPEDCFPVKQSAFLAERHKCCSKYERNIVHRSRLLLLFSAVLPEHLWDWSRIQLQSISSVLETRLPRLQISFSDLQGHQSSIPEHVLEYPKYGRSRWCCCKVLQTIKQILPVCRRRSFPVFQTDGFGIPRVLPVHEHLFLYGSMENRKLMYMAVPFHQWSDR